VSAFSSKKPDYLKAIRAANELLAIHNVISAPVPVIEIARDEGLSVFSISLERYHRLDKPVCAALDIERKLIFIEEKDCHERQRFSIAHELGHWRIHPNELKDHPEIGIVFRAPIEGETVAIEREANCFAANLLIPKKLLRYWFARIQNQHQLAEIFAVSSDVIGWRLKKDRERLSEYP
jgi:Zn-dependent peptidase ImmA (M78 family)